MLGIELRHTTAYHLQSNGLVERFHRHLKAALRARLTGSNWTAELLLGAPKDELGCSSAELAYGAPLMVPGDFLVSHNSQPEHRSQLQQLRDQVRMQVPMPTSQHEVIPSSNLKQSQFVFVRWDAHRTPYNALTKDHSKSCRHAGDKTFTIDRGGRKEVISVDRLKPAFVDLEHPVVVSEPKSYGLPPNKDHLVIPTQPQEQIKIADPVQPLRT